MYFRYNFVLNLLKKNKKIYKLIRVLHYHIPIFNLKKNIQKKERIKAYHILQKMISKNIKTIKFEKNDCVIEFNNDCKFFWNPNNVEDTLLYPIILENGGFYETDEINRLISFIDKNDIIFDIGANIGWYSMLFSKKATSGEIHAFEPTPKTLKRLQSNCKLNNTKNIIINNLAISNKIGKIKLYSCITNTHGNSIKLQENIKNTKYEEYLIDSITIDSYISKNKIKKLDLIKCDIEGAELLMLKGAKECLKKFKPILQLEVSDNLTKIYGYSSKSTFKYLNDYGYVGYYANDKNNLEKIKAYNKYDSIKHPNILFFHTDKHKHIIFKN